jgi:hypothetical protein
MSELGPGKDRRHNGVGMIAQKCPPSLRWRAAAPGHVLGDRRLGDLEPELQQFTMDARGAPIVDFPCSSVGSVPAAPGQPWVFPVEREISNANRPETLRAMPPQNRVGLNHAGPSEQAWPEPRHPDDEDPVTMTQPQTVWCAPKGNIELVPKKKVLDFELPP